MLNQWDFQLDSIIHQDFQFKISAQQSVLELITMEEDFVETYVKELFGAKDVVLNMLMLTCVTTTDSVDISTHLKVLVFGYLIGTDKLAVHFTAVSKNKL